MRVQIDQAWDQRVPREIDAPRPGETRARLARGKDFADAATGDDDRVVGQGPRWIDRDDPGRFDDENGVIGQRCLRL